MRNNLQSLKNPKTKGQCLRHKSGNICGFTLIELLVVMGVITVLAAMSIFGLQGARESGRDARRKGDLETIRSGLELYKADCRRYPASLTTGASLTGDGTNCPATNVYIQNIPDDPISGRDYVYIPAAAPAQTYTICASLEGNTSPDSVCTTAGAVCGSTCSYHVANP